MARSVVATIRGVVNVFWDTDRSGVFTMLALLLLPTGESESRPLPASPPAECREQKAFCMGELLFSANWLAKRT